jgi:aryl-alcohol dehydrogenase-like predicted oxidoreductase
MLERGIEAELIPVCEKHGIGLLPYYPIAQGLLTGKYKRGDKAPAGSRLAGNDAALAAADYDLLDRLAAYAGDHGYDLLTLAMSWLAAQPSMACIITGGSRPEQMAANAAAVRWTLTAENLKEIDGLLAA